MYMMYDILYSYVYLIKLDIRVIVTKFRNNCGCVEGVDVHKVQI